MSLSNYEIIRSEIFRFSVDYRLSLPEMIEAAHYDNFEAPGLLEAVVTGEGVREYEGRLYGSHPYRAWSRMAECIRLDDSENPWRVADIAQTVGFSTAFPNQQLEYDIFGLGTTIGKPEAGYVPRLGSTPCGWRHPGEKKRELSWLEWGDRWSGDRRWLAVREVR